MHVDKNKIILNARCRANDAQKGFTIIELLVVISIMATMAGLFLVNFAGTRGPRNLRLAQNELVTNIRKIQSYTLSARDVNSTNAARYYILRLIQGSNTYEMQAIGVNKSTSVQTYYDGSSAAVDFIERFRMPSGISALSVVNSAGTTVNPTPLCVQTGFSLPFAKTYVEYNPVSSSCNFLTVTSTAANLDAKANHTLTITLRDAASNTTRQVVVRGVTGSVETK